MIRAFVSSTYVDLKEHRAYVIGRLTAAGIFVDPMEKWTATNDDPKQLYIGLPFVAAPRQSFGRAPHSEMALFLGHTLS